jgi:hypothetical protein
MARMRERLVDPLLVRTSEFATLHETLLVTAVTTVLVIRTQLWLTNYPQLGGGGLHIAHLLYGGFFMLAAIALTLTFLGRPVRHRAAIIGGVGFGFFIDELGKFITADNNYFYKPAAGAIYVVFVMLFLLARWAQRRQGFSSREYVSNALELVGEAARHQLDEDERRRALELLDRADQDDPMVTPLRELLAQVATIPRPSPSTVTRWLTRMRERGERIAGAPRFPGTLIALFTIWALLSALAAFQLALSVGLDLGGAHPGFVSDQLSDLRLQNFLSMGSSLVSAVLVGVGIARLRAGERVACGRWFERALLVSIFVTQVFNFVESQMGAVFGLAIDLLLLAGVRRLLASATRIAPTSAHAIAAADATAADAPAAVPTAAIPAASDLR